MKKGKEINLIDSSQFGFIRENFYLVSYFKSFSRASFPVAVIITWSDFTVTIPNVPLSVVFKFWGERIAKKVDFTTAFLLLFLVISLSIRSESIQILNHGN